MKIYVYNMTGAYMRVKYTNNIYTHEYFPHHPQTRRVDIHTIGTSGASAVCFFMYYIYNIYVRIYFYLDA